jgi:hypothetical protein
MWALMKILHDCFINGSGFYTTQIVHVKETLQCSITYQKTYGGSVGTAQYIFNLGTG